MTRNTGPPPAWSATIPAGLFCGALTRAFSGPFPRFQAPPGTIVAAPDTAGLITRMQHAEFAARAHIPRPPQTPRTASQPNPGG